MSESEVVLERLTSVLSALERIPRRFASISAPADFLASDAGIDRMDAICMILIATGEQLKAIDRKTGGKLLPRYPSVPWSAVMGVRDVLPHGYFEVNTEQLFGICKADIPVLIATIRQMICDLRQQGE